MLVFDEATQQRIRCAVNDIGAAANSFKNLCDLAQEVIKDQRKVGGLLSPTTTRGTTTRGTRPKT